MRFKKPCPAKLSALLLSAMLACGGPVHAETVTETANLIKAALASHGTVKGEITLKTGNAKPVAQRTAGGRSGSFSPAIGSSMESTCGRSRPVCHSSSA